MTMLESQLRKLLFHYFINKQETVAYNLCKHNLLLLSHQNSHMVQMDFSEDFSCIYQNEVSSAHWRTSRVSSSRSQMFFKIGVLNGTEAICVEKVNVMKK